MPSNKDNMYDLSASNFQKQKGDLTQSFNQHRDEPQLLNSLSQQGKEEYLQSKKQGEKVVADLVQKQRQTRWSRCKDEALIWHEDNYLNPSPKPQGIQANLTADVKIIREQAQRNVLNKDAHQLMVLKDQNQHTLEKIVTQDRLHGQARDNDRQLNNQHDSSDRER